MKKLILTFTVIASMFLCVGAKAQSTTDYFTGKWKVIIMGTPQGDATMMFVFEKKDGKLTGALRDSTDKEISKITQIDEKDKSITAYFNTQGYDVNLMLEPLDADRVKGSLMGMFAAKGERVKN
ncbi:hypothetical protein [Mucilaginibacter sp.]|jgi:hypothetical protein|uniref:hypothetical protein n=1 Tax=Mucilaginibacter sp. TaxID=1882438 RepID=UPI003568433B